MKKQLVLLCAALWLVSCGDESTSKIDTNNTPDDMAGSDSMAEVDIVPTDTDDTLPDETGDGLLSDEDGLVANDTDPNCQPGDFPDVCGSWAQVMIFTSTANGAGFDVVIVEIRTLSLLTQRQQGGHLWVDSKMCHIEIINKTALNPVKILMPQSFADALILLHKEADITIDGNYFQPTYWELRSVDQTSIGADPSAYELPTTPDDPRAEDWDNNDIKGLTVLINAGFSNGTTHIVQKSSSELTGVVAGTGQDQMIGGTVYWTEKQAVLTTDNPLFKTGMQNIIDESKPNTWQQKRIPAEWSCTDVTANGGTLFPQ